jgi:hypothetical protein
LRVEITAPREVYGAMETIEGRAGVAGFWVLISVQRRALFVFILIFIFINSGKIAGY